MPFISSRSDGARIETRCIYKQLRLRSVQNLLRLLLQQGLPDRTYSLLPSISRKRLSSQIHLLPATCAHLSLSASPSWALLSLETPPQLAVARLLSPAAPSPCRSTARTASTSSRFPTTTRTTSPTALFSATTGVMAT